MCTGDRAVRTREDAGESGSGNPNESEKNEVLMGMEGKGPRDRSK